MVVRGWGLEEPQIFHYILSFSVAIALSQRLQNASIHIKPARGIAAEVESRLHLPRALHLLICIDTIEQGSKLHHKGEGDICCHREIFGQAYIQHREC